MQHDNNASAKADNNYYLLFRFFSSLSLLSVLFAQYFFIFAVNLFLDQRKLILWIQYNTI